MVLPLFRAFFYPRPVAFSPCRDGFFVAFASPPFGLLATPSHPSQHMPDSRGIVMHSELFFLARQPHGTGSTGCWHTRVFRAPAAAAFAAALFGRLSIWQDDLYAGWVSGLGGRAVDRRFSIVKPLPGLPQNAERFSSRTSPVPATRWLPACVAPFLRLIVSSSYRIQSAKSGCLNEFFKGQ